MKYLTWLACTMFFFSCRSVTTTDSNAKGAILAAMQQSADDWNRGSLDDYMKLYGTEATFMFQSGPVGLKRIRENYQKVFFDGDKPKQQLRYADMVVRPLGKKHALLTGKFVLSGNGLPERLGIYTLIFVRRSSGWKVAHDHSS